MRMWEDRGRAGMNMGRSPAGVIIRAGKEKLLVQTVHGQCPNRPTSGMDRLWENGEGTQGKAGVRGWGVVGIMCHRLWNARTFYPFLKFSTSTQYFLAWDSKNPAHFLLWVEVDIGRLGGGVWERGGSLCEKPWAKKTLFLSFLVPRN